MTQLRFAPIIRVSTEGQEKKGESLRTQKKQILRYVEAVNGVIPDHCWMYSGQEHATSAFERKKLNQLLADAGKDLFDAVIVCDASRWSRDNLKSKEGLNVLRDNGIRFFVGSSEYDLFDPAKNLFLGMSAEIGEFQAAEQARKSIINRIERANRGIPSLGKLPFGRTFNKATLQWGIDPEKHIIIKQAAKRYLSGEGMIDIATSYGINPSGLWGTLRKKCGDKWEVHFTKKDLKIDETVIMTIPRLLPEETIKAIHAKGAANKTYTHGQIKNKYLLSRMIFCQECEYTLFGYTNHSGKQYYNHARAKNKKPCLMHRHIPANQIESATLMLLAATFGDNEKIQKAVEKAQPDMEKIKAMKNERTQLERIIFKADKQRDNLVSAVSKGLLKDEVIEKRMKSIEKFELEAKNRIDVINGQLNNLPDPDQIKKLSMFKGKVWQNLSKKNPTWILQKSFEFKRSLLEKAFGGVDPKGKRYGVYVKYDEEKSQWEFKMHGIIGNELMTLPLDRLTIIELYHLDPDYQDVDKEIERIENEITSFTRQMPFILMPNGSTSLLPRIPIAATSILMRA